MLRSDVARLKSALANLAIHFEPTNPVGMAQLAQEPPAQVQAADAEDTVRPVGSDRTSDQDGTTDGTVEKQRLESREADARKAAAAGANLRAPSLRELKVAEEKAEQRQAQQTTDAEAAAERQRADPPAPSQGLLNTPDPQRRGSAPQALDLKELIAKLRVKQLGAQQP